MTAAIEGPRPVRPVDLLTTKLHVLRPPPGFVPRRRLVAALDDGLVRGRVLVSARKLNELGVVDAELAVPALVEETTRALSAPELVASGQAETGLPETGLLEIEPAEIGTPESAAAEPGPAEIGRPVGLVRAAR